MEQENWWDECRLVATWALLLLDNQSRWAVRPYK